MDYENITTDSQLRDYCSELAQSPSIAFDTEFVSEHTYRPVLCLVQVASGGRLAVIDALAIADMKPFWDAILGRGHEIVVHAGRGEMEFCLQAIGQMPERLFDVQLPRGWRALSIRPDSACWYRSSRPIVAEARDPHRLATPPAVEAADRIRPGRRLASASAPRQALASGLANWAAWAGWKRRWPTGKRT